MAQRPFDDPRSPEALEREARRATADLLARVVARHRRTRRFARFHSRETIADIVVTMATYTGVTVAVILGAIHGISAAVGLLGG